jgi:RNA polymerase sigma-70 factor (ECF subfamily)
VQRASVLDFDATFDANYTALVRYCRGLTGDPDLAEDVAQESLYRLFGNELRATPSGVRAWLFKTATHLVRDRHRVESNRRRLLEQHHEGPSGADPPDRALARAEARDLARAALAQLTPRDREVLMMRYSGFSYREIADVVGLAVGSVGTTLARAERRFAEVMQGAQEAV